MRARVCVAARSGGGVWCPRRGVRVQPLTTTATSHRRCPFPPHTQHTHRTLTPPTRTPTGKLEAELVAATRRMSAVLQRLPREITPVNLEELRRVKQLLVELESKAENLRCVRGAGVGRE